VSLRARVAAAAGVAVALTVLVAAVVVYVAVRSNLRAEVDRALLERVDRAGAPDAFGRGPRGPRGPLPPRERFGGAEGFVQRVTPAGEPLRPPGAAAATLPVSVGAREIAARGSGRRFEDLDAAGTRVRVLTTGTGLGAIQVARPLAEVDAVLGRVLVVLVVVGAGGILLAAGLGLAVARVALDPIARFTRRTEEIAADPDPSDRMEVRGRDELARLARTFNATLEALEASVDAQRALVADASHELRTPIASLRANIQVLEHADRLDPDDLAALRADVVSELDELTALVADVVELARGDRPPADPEDVRLDDLVRGMLERAERRAGPPVTFRADLEPTLVRGDRERIARAVSNLLDNARRWSPPGAEVDVRLAEGTLSVRDRGPGFAPEDLPHVFDRFYRAAAARGMSGSGLGLAIVRQAADAHGGWARAANAPDGGAVVEVRFAPEP
jgi:two-component system, OmpR family, sensor histidine kinase MprB